MNTSNFLVSPNPQLLNIEIAKIGKPFNGRSFIKN